MKTKEFIYQIESNSIFNELDNLLKITKEIFNKNYKDKKVYPIPHDKSYSDSLFHYKIKQLNKQLPSFEKRFKFEIGLFEISAYIYIGIDNCERHEASAITSLYFSTDFEFLNDLKFELPNNLNLNNPIPQLKQLLHKYISPQGFYNGIQFVYEIPKQKLKDYKQQIKQAKRNNALTNEFKSTFSNLKNVYEESFNQFHFNKALRKLYKITINEHMDDAPSFNIIKTFDVIKKRFNIVAYDIAIEDVIDFVNKNGKQSLIKTKDKNNKTIYKKIELQEQAPFNLDFLDSTNFDGDIDEAEELFWENYPKKPEHVTIINL